MEGRVMTIEEMLTEYAGTIIHTRIDKVIFSDPATIVFWNDGTKTVVKCQGGDTFSPHTGLAMACAKKLLGNKGNYYEQFKKWMPEDYQSSDPVKIDPQQLTGTMRSVANALKEGIEAFARLAPAYTMKKKKEEDKNES